MRVLLLEPDPQIRALVRRSLEPEGHEVFALANAEQAMAVLRSRPADLVVCALEPGSSEGGQLLKMARGQLGQTTGLLMSAFHSVDDAELVTALTAFSRSDFLQKPFAEGELVEQLRRLIRSPLQSPNLSPAAPRRVAPTTVLPDRGGPVLRVATAQQPAPEPERISISRPLPVHLENVRLIARLWLTRAVGTLCLSGGPAGSDGWASISAGGPVDAESRLLIEAALRGGELTFEAVEINIPGDWEGLGLLLWRVLKDPTQHSFVVENRFQALTRTSGTAAAAHLPLSAQTRRLLSLADGHVTLGETVAREGLDANLVSPELQALVQLRLVTLQTPLAAPSRRPEAPPMPNQGYGGSSGVASLGSERSGLGSGTGSNVHRAGVAARPRHPTLDSRTDMGPGDTRRSTAPGPASVGSRTPMTRDTRRARAFEALTSQIPRATASRATQTGSAGEATHARAQIRQVLQRLTREAGDLGAASPAVVLGIPSDASAELVQEASARMRSRYTQMAGDEALPPEARELAGQILERVEEAARTFGKARAAQAAAAMDEERLLSLGRDLISQRQWEQAERVLTRARHIKSDHPAVLANLAWARLHNPARPAETRASDARELLSLSEQFDAQNGEGQYYLAELLYRLREYDAALPRAERAVRASPDNAAAASLARKLRARLASGH